MNAGQGQADDQAAEGTVVGLGRGNAEDAQDEDEGQDDLNKQGRKSIAAHAGQAVAAEGAGHILDMAELEDQRQKSRTHKRADALCNDITRNVLFLHAAGEKHPQRDGRVDVAARDVADAVGHGNDRKAEGERGQDVAAAHDRIAADQHGRPAAQHDQRAGADCFGKVFFHNTDLLKKTFCSTVPIINPIPRFVTLFFPVFICPFSPGY